MNMSWYGDLPERWEVRQLKQCAKICNGKNYSNIAVSEGGYPVMGSGGEFARASLYIYNKPSVLFGRKGTIDKPMYIDYPFWSVDTMFYTIVDNDVNAKYLYYASTQIRFDYYKTSTAIPSMTQRDLGSEHIPLPPREEQDQIVRYLDWKVSQINKLINAKRRQIALLGEQRQAVINAAFMGDWHYRKLSIYAIIGDGLHGTPFFSEDGEYFFINGNNLGNKKITIYANTKTVDGSEYNKYKIALSGRTLLVSLNGTIGSLSFYNGEKVVLGKSAGYITNIDNDIDINFLYHYLQCGNVLELFKLSTSETTIANLSLQTLRNLPLPTMPVLEQKAIASHLDYRCAIINKLIAKLNDEITLFTEYRTRLISDVVTGKLDVRGVVVPEYEAVEDVVADEEAGDTE